MKTTTKPILSCILLVLSNASCANILLEDIAPTESVPNYIMARSRFVPSVSLTIDMPPGSQERTLEVFSDYDSTTSREKEEEEEEEETEEQESNESDPGVFSFEEDDEEYEKYEEELEKYEEDKKEITIGSSEDDVYEPVSYDDEADNENDLFSNQTDQNDISGNEEDFEEQEESEDSTLAILDSLNSFLQTSPKTFDLNSLSTIYPPNTLMNVNDASLLFADNNVFVIDSKLGKGNRGAVFKALQYGTNPVAIKFVPFVEKKSEASFALEVECIGKLGRLFTFGVIEPVEGDNEFEFQTVSTGFIAMNFIAGDTLANTLLNATSIEQIEIIEKASIEAVKSFFSTTGKVHYDLVPENFIVSPKNEVSLIDFEQVVDPSKLTVSGQFYMDGQIATFSTMIASVKLLFQQKIPLNWDALYEVGGDVTEAQKLALYESLINK